MRRVARHLQTDRIVQVLQSTGEHYEAASVLMTLECPEVKVVASWGTVPQFRENPQAQEPRLFRTIQRPLPMVIEDVHQEMLDECAALGPDLRFYASFPIRLDDSYVGSVILTSPTPRPYTSVRHFQVLEEAADNIGMLLQEQLQNENS